MKIKGDIYMKKNNLNLFEKIFATVGIITFFMFFSDVVAYLLFDIHDIRLTVPFLIWTSLCGILWITIDLILNGIWNLDIHFFSKREKEE